MCTNGSVIGNLTHSKNDVRSTETLAGKTCRNRAGKEKEKYITKLLSILFEGYFIQHILYTAIQGSLEEKS